VNQFGAGRAVYIGALGDGQLYDVLANWLLDPTSIQNTFTIPPGVEVSQRTQGDKTLHFVLNHKDTPQTIHLENHFTNLLSRQPFEGDVQLQPFDVLILE
jgi:beta-galactosidase